MTSGKSINHCGSVASKAERHEMDNLVEHDQTTPKNELPVLCAKRL